MTVAARAKLPGLDARRADTIYAGAVVFRTALELAGAEQATLCETALREGIIADYVVSNRPGILLVEEFPDLRRRSVMELARRCQFREDHGTHVARLALSIFHQTRRLHKLADADAELLEFAALLHDIGFYISPHRHHRHSEYLIKSHAMTGFSRSEVENRAHRAPPPQDRAAPRARRHQDDLQGRLAPRALPGGDPAGGRRARSHPRPARAGGALLDFSRTVEVRVDADGDPELELWAARRKGDSFEALAGRKLRFAVDGLKEREEHPAAVTPAPAPLRVVRASARSTAAASG